MVGPNQDQKPTDEISQKLVRWLDEGTNSGGQRYLEVRRRLELYFDRKNCVGPSELADQTLNRVARNLEDNAAIPLTPFQYCYSVARYVFLEALGAQKGAPFYRPIDGTGTKGSSERSATSLGTSPKSASTPEKETAIGSCLAAHLKKLPSADRDLFVEYYRGKQRARIAARAALASRLGLTSSALQMRAAHIRQKLEACIRSNAEESEEREILPSREQ